MFGSVEKIEKITVEFDEKRILKLIGYKKRSTEIKEPIKSLITEEKKKLDYLLHPASIYIIVGYDETNKHLIFKDAENVAICICTIGPELEREVKKLMEKDEMVKALILDALGSEAVEEVTIQSDRMLAEKAREMNLWPSKRFSPGFGKWDIKEQRFIFRMLPAADIGVRLTKSCMMVTRKSVSFRINFYKEQKLSTRRRSPKVL